MTSGQLHIQPHNTMEVGNSNQELLTNGSMKKKTTCVVLIVVLFAFVIAALLYFIIPSSTPFQTYQKSIVLKSILGGEYSASSFNGTWISDSEVIYKSKIGDIMLFNAATNSSKLILSIDVEAVSTAFSYELSADRRYLILGRNYQKFYRYSFLAYYTFLNLDTLETWPLTDLTGEEIAVQLVSWSPVGNAYVYVYKNDIYYRTSARQPNSQEFRLSRNGRPGTIYNGIPDWVYEEEIFRSNKALWFSLDGTFLAYATFNDSQTPVMNIPYYGTPGDLRFQYIQAKNISYPKPGRPNPVVSLTLLNLAQLEFQKDMGGLDLPPSVNLRDPVLFKVKWAGPTGLVFVWLNRVQNEGFIYYYSTINGNISEILHLKESTGWVILEDPLFSPNFTHMAIILPFDQGSGAGNYRHLALINLNEHNPQPVPLTSGRFVVTEIVAYDSNFIYFMSNAHGHPGELKVYKVPSTIERAPHIPECISCSHEITSSGKCQYFGASFSLKNAFFVQTCLGPVIPEVNIFKRNGEKVITWESNKRLRNILKMVVMPKESLMEVEVAPGMKAMVQLLVPPSADLSGRTKYPLLVHVYGGPDTNSVIKRFKINWDSFLVVNKSIIIARIDGRGSGLQGDTMAFANYRNLGKYEVEDQITVTKSLIETLPYIDASKTAIWGWSYGGYVTAMALSKDTQDIFKCGISVAPVTDWILYDTLYTETFMGLPLVEDNLHGYNNASLYDKVENLRHKKFFLIHGTLDDNVHYQQGMMLAKTLQEKDILFEQLSYPDEAHGLTGVRPHLFHSMTHFLDECFGIKDE